jgi:hypothetical protein
MNDDILEQLVEDYLQAKGYFTRHNIKYRPKGNSKNYVKQADAVHSDIDVIGYNPKEADPRRVIVVSCKSYHDGFNLDRLLRELKQINPKDPQGRLWKRFRELVVPKWSSAYRSKVKEVTGLSRFTYVSAFVKVEGSKSNWLKHQPFKNAMGRNPIDVLTIEEMVGEVLKPLLEAHTPVSSQFGRTLQQMKDAGYYFHLLPKEKLWETTIGLKMVKNRSYPIADLLELCYVEKDEHGRFKKFLRTCTKTVGSLKLLRVKDGVYKFL